MRQIRHRKRPAYVQGRALLYLRQRNLVIHFFPLPDHQALGQLLLGKGGVYIRDLLVVDRHASLLHQTAGLLLGGRQLALDHQVQNADASLGQVPGGQGGGGHVLQVAAPYEQRLGGLLGLFGLLFSVD